MSAILGIYNLDDTPVNRGDLVQMSEKLKHRGQDGSGIWQEEAIGLGHQMLWTTPESLLEELPMQRQAKVMTADARIDNREELIDALKLQGLPAEITDCDLILAAYEQWGEHCPEHLLGDFAFAIWDQAKQQLFCARDHFGVKPFYYYCSERSFIFATEIKGILCLSPVPRQLNRQKIAEHFSGQCHDGHQTFYTQVLRLPPAHSFSINSQGITQRCYWQLNPHQELRLESDAAYAAAFRELFTEAVRCRLRSHLPIGSMLSGGLDSSSIACVAQKLLSNQVNAHPLHTFSNIHEQVPSCDERFYQNAVLAQGDFQPHFINTDQISPLADLERVLWHQDEVQGLGNFYAAWSRYGVAQRQGVRVILDGFDGDTTVSHGKGRLVELAIAGRWVKLAIEVKAFSKNLRQPWKKALWGWVWLYGLSKFRLFRGVRRLYQGLGRSLSRSPNPQSVSPQGIPSAALMQEIESTQPSTIPFTRERAFHHQLLTDPGEWNTLEKLNNAAAAFGLDIRFPFWDKRLVEFCLSLPPEQKLNQGWSRLVLRRAMADILPPEIQWRGYKTNHAESFNYTLLKFEQARLGEIIFDHPETIEPYVNLTALHETYQRFICQQATEDEVLMLWKVLSLSVWLQSTGLQVFHDNPQGGDESANKSAMNALIG
jgi:asparagine synthase (glutamine-hydrolysing)